MSHNVSVNVSFEVTPATLHILMINLEAYEPGISEYIQELCGVHKNNDIETWFALLSKFALMRYYPPHQDQDNYNLVGPAYSIGDDALGLHATERGNAVYVGELIRNKTIQKHCKFLTTMQKMSGWDNQEPSHLDYFNWLKICQKWGDVPINRFGVKCISRNHFMKFADTAEYRDNHYEIIKSANSPVLKCDVILWTMNQRDMHTGDCIDNDSNNVIELVYHVPAHLSNATDTQVGINKISCFVQGCVTTAIARDIKKMPLYTKFNPILQQHEYTKNFMSEYINS